MVHCNMGTTAGSRLVQRLSATALQSQLLTNLKNVFMARYIAVGDTPNVLSRDVWFPRD
jgi:hypothetical protein